jgi:hypothetical protein
MHCVSGGRTLLRRTAVFLLVSMGVLCGPFASGLHAQGLTGIEVHGFVTQGFLFSSQNNYLTMKSSDGSAQWTDGAVSVSDSLTERLRVGGQLHMYQLGDLGGPSVGIDWASGDYRVNDYLGFRAGKVKTVLGLFNDAQDVDAIFLWTLLPQCSYPVDNKSFFLAHLGGDVYGNFSLGRHGGKLGYSGYVGQVRLDLDGGFVKQAGQFGLLFSDSPRGETYGGDLRWETPLKGLMVGSSVDVEALDGKAPAGNLHVAPYVITAQYAEFTRGKLLLAGEYDRTPGDAVVTVGGFAIPVPQDLRSWYAMGSYRLLKRLDVGSYYSHFVNKGQDTTLPANYSKDFVLSARYDINPYFYWKIEGHFLHGTALGYYADSNPNGLRPNSNMLAAKLGFSF